MLACFLRSALMVKLETPMSYLPLWTPRMIESKPAGTHSVLRPNLAMTALKSVDVHADDGLAVGVEELVGR